MCRFFSHNNINILTQRASIKCVYSELLWLFLTESTTTGRPSTTDQHAARHDIKACVYLLIFLISTFPTISNCRLYMSPDIGGHTVLCSMFFMKHSFVMLSSFFRSNFFQGYYVMKSGSLLFWGLSGQIKMATTFFIECIISITYIGLMLQDRHTKYIKH